MPYIDNNGKQSVEQIGPRISGSLNYALTQVCIGYLEAKGLGYQTINDVLGALEGAKQEFYRRVAVPYEERKLAENGDVYPPTNGGV